MKYFISKEYIDNETRKNYRRKHLFCYDLRANEEFSNALTIERLVITDRFGSIITNEKIELDNLYPNDFIDFQTFTLNNEEVKSIAELY